MSNEKQRLPRTDIPSDYKCPYPGCGFQPKTEKARELAFRNHMAQTHGVYYESAGATKVPELAGLPRHAKDLEALTELKPWHCVALARHVVYGQPFTEVGKEMKHSAESIKAVAKSPAGQAYIAKIEAEVRDPVKMVHDLMKSDAIEMHLMWLQARDWAFQAKDYEAIHKMAKDIGLQPILQDTQKAGPTKISLHLNMGDLAPPVAKTSFTVVEDPEYLLETGPADDAVEPE